MDKITSGAFFELLNDTIIINKDYGGFDFIPLQGDLRLVSHQFKYIKVDDANKFYDSRNNCNAVIKTQTNVLGIGCENTIIDSSIEMINDYAFIHANEFDIVIPKTLKRLSLYAFADSLVKNITFEEGSNEMLCSICYKMNNIDTINIPSSILNYDKRIFHGNMVKHIKVNNSNPILKMINGLLIDIKTKTILKATLDFNGDIPNDIINISEGAFENYKNDHVKDIVFPKSCINIEKCAFSNAKFNSLTFLGELKTISNSSFNNIEINYISAINTDPDLPTTKEDKLLFLKGFILDFNQNNYKKDYKKLYDDFINRDFKYLLKQPSVLKDEVILNYILKDATFTKESLNRFIESCLGLGLNELAASLTANHQATLNNINNSKDLFLNLIDDKLEQEILAKYSIRELDNEIILYKYVGDELDETFLPSGMLHNKPIRYDQNLFKMSHPRILHINKDFDNTFDTGLNFPYLWYVVLQDGITDFDMDKLQINCKTLLIPSTCKHININKHHCRYRKLEFLGTKQEAKINGIYDQLEEYRKTLPLTEEVKYNPFFTIDAPSYAILKKMGRI